MHRSHLPLTTWFWAIYLTVRASYVVEQNKHLNYFEKNIVYNITQTDRVININVIHATTLLNFCVLRLPTIFLLLDILIIRNINGIDAIPLTTAAYTNA